METDPEAGCERLGMLCESLSVLQSEYQAQEAIDLGYSTGAEMLEIRTSMGRELVFLSSHAVHHMAIVSLLVELIGIVPPKDFGVHPSTLRHWDRHKQA